jgi:hypothetical protein
MEEKDRIIKEKEEKTKKIKQEKKDLEEQMRKKDEILHRFTSNPAFFDNTRTI